MNCTNKNQSFRPLMILAYTDSAHAALCGRYFRRMGWEVHLVATAAEICRLLNIFAPRAIVLDTELPDENAWQICAEIVRQNQDQRIVLLTPETACENQRAPGLGVAVPMVSRREPIAVLAEAVLGQKMAEAV